VSVGAAQVVSDTLVMTEDGAAGARIPMTLPVYEQRLAEMGLGAWVPALTAFARRSSRLVAGGACDSLGVTKLGGRPDLADATSWPAFRGRPLSFVAQIDLSDTEPHHLDMPLPASGLLSFFYDSAENGVWGFDPADKGGWAVIHTATDQPLRRRDFPSGLSDAARFGEVGLRPLMEWTFIPSEYEELESLGMTREEIFAYAAAVESDEQVIHRLAGHPDPVQGDMRFESQLASNGLYCGDSTAYQDPRAAELMPGVADWHLLLQVDSEEDIGMMWGDVGRLYFWMRESDLAQCNWPAAWLVLQCG
jgi:uncharacterized protein YwqG